MGPSEGVLCVRQKNEERYALLTQFYTTNIFELETCSLRLGMTLFGALEQLAMLTLARGAEGSARFMTKIPPLYSI